MLRIIDLHSSRSRCARLFSSPSVAALLLMAISSQALASPISYGSISGTTVDYIDIEENSGTDPGYFPPNAPLGLFGAPTVAGDSIDFSPNNFFADSQFGAVPDLTDGHLTFGVNSKPGHAIQNINFQEGGGVSVVGVGTDATFVDVSAVGFINVLEIDGAAPAGLPVIPINLTFNFGVAGDGTWRRASEGFVNGFLWTGAQAIDIKGWLNANGFPTQYGATKITVSLDNSLYAQSEATSGAYIDKKDFGGLSITINTPNIPEPTTFVLGLAGCLAVGAIRRSR
jgi:hypothetical protein